MNSHLLRRVIGKEHCLYLDGDAVGGNGHDIDARALHVETAVFTDCHGIGIVSVAHFR